MNTAKTKKRLGVKAAYAALTFIFIAIILFVALLLYWEFWPVTVIDIKDGATVETMHATQGQPIAYSITYCKYLDLDATVVREIDSEDFQTVTVLDNVIRHIPTGCHKSTNVSLVIPAGLAPGQYILTFSASYKVNPIREVVNHYRSNVFTVYAK